MLLFVRLSAMLHLVGLAALLLLVRLASMLLVRLAAMLLVRLAAMLLISCQINCYLTFCETSCCVPT